MAESLRLRLWTRRILEQIRADPDGEWTITRIRGLPNSPEWVVNEVIRVLLETGAATAEPTGRSMRQYREHTISLVPEYRFRLADGGPLILEQVLEASRSLRGVIASFLFEGGITAALEWRRLRARSAVAPRFWQRRRRQLP